MGIPIKRWVLLVLIFCLSNLAAQSLQNQEKIALSTGVKAKLAQDDDSTNIRQAFHATPYDTQVIKGVEYIFTSKDIPITVNRESTATSLTKNLEHQIFVQGEVLILSGGEEGLFVAKVVEKNVEDTKLSNERSCKKIVLTPTKHTVVDHKKLPSKGLDVPCLFPNEQHLATVISLNTKVAINQVNTNLFFVAPESVDLVLPVIIFTELRTTYKSRKHLHTAFSSFFIRPPPSLA